MTTNAYTLTEAVSGLAYGFTTGATTGTSGLGTTPWQTDIEATLEALAVATYEGSTYGSTANYIQMGKVGFGTTSPDSELDVQGADDVYIEVEATGANSDAGFQMQNDAQTWQFRLQGGNNDIFSLIDIGNFKFPFRIEPGASLRDNQIYLANDGHTGFGTDSPAASIDNRGTFRSGTTANYSEFEADGTLKFNGTATVWDDLRTPVNNLKVPASKNPEWGAFNGGQALYFSDQAVEGNQEEVYFTLQMPHSWKAGSTKLGPHIHVSTTGAANGDAMRWGFVYSWANIGSTFPAGTTSYVTDSGFGGSGGDHRFVAFPNISGAGKTISSILQCRLFRASASTEDTSAGDGILLEFDMHYEIDTVGSRATTVK